MILNPRVGRVRAGLIPISGLLALMLLVASCSASSTNVAHSKLQVVVAENFWGSIVQQLAGTHANVTSIVANPNTDPHDYESTPKDNREMASAQYVIVNGIGYDPWAEKALKANSSKTRKVLNVGDMLGLHDGDNPHQWYSPNSVQKFIVRVTTDLKNLDPQNARAYDDQRTAYETHDLATYNSLIAQIKQKYGGIPVGASESIFTPMAQALNLDLVTPKSFLNAIAEGSEPTAADKTTVDEQVHNKKIKVFVFNSQNSTPDVQRLVHEAHTQNIPVTTITETLTPKNATFQSWQVKQLQALERALESSAT